MKVDNAIIMAAGTSSRFAPLSYEYHKALTEVRGERLIERQIIQLKSAGISEIYIVTGYKAEQFNYLVEKHNVRLIHNPEYLTRNNNGSIWAARDVLSNSFICSADNFFTINPFENEVDEAYYAAEYAEGYTKEWCMSEDDNGYISSVTVGGENAWYMLGHTFWSAVFSSKFMRILESEYNDSECIDKLWENIYIEHLDELKMKIRKYEPGVIYEFDTLDELRQFDTSYIFDTRSTILKSVIKILEIEEDDVKNIITIKGDDAKAVGFKFDCSKGHYTYNYESEVLEKREG